MFNPTRTGWSNRAAILLLGAVVTSACDKSRTDHRPTVAPAITIEPPAKPLPDPELGEVFIIDEWTIRMPKGYGLQSQQQRDGTIAASWHAPAGDPPVGPRLFAITCIHFPQGKQKPTTAQLRTSPPPQSGLTEYQETEPEVVPIGGRNFERVLTTCSAALTGRIVRGFQYVSVGQPCIAMVYQGAAEDDESFREADAAARSLRQR